ncbi:MAG: Hsp70 family protein [Phycisphaeraceae bacterium]|nr:Hsp70 family protein [Phycisphaeraceae bacterium]
MSNAGRTKRYVGIDLGTTFCAVAYLDNHGQPVTIPNAEGSLVTPSVVLFEPTGDVVVGQEAKRSAVIEPDLTVECVKREMGERWYSRQIMGRQLPPPAIAAMILRKLKQDSEAKIGPIDGAVITVPAYFDEGRRQATIAAGQIAGLEVLDILNEPTAAALAYAYRDFLHKSDDVNEIIRLVDETVPGHHAVVYDLGGGTFDVTVLRIEGKDLTVLATDGDVRLGGKDWDERIVNYVAEAFKQKHNQDPRQDKHAMQGLFASAEEAKKNLSVRAKTRIVCTHAGQTMTVDLTREQFEQMTADLLYRTESRVNRVIDAAGLKWGQVDQVLTVGGSTRMPQVLELLKRVTGRPANTSLSPDEVVAHGAAIHAAIRLFQMHHAQTKRQTKAAKPKTPKPKAVEEPLTPRAIDQADVLPMLTDEDLTDTGAEPSMETTVQDAVVDPAQDPVAWNPSAQFDDKEATQVLRAITTSNVNAHSLGVVMTRPDKSKVNSIIIPRNTSLPTSVTKRYGTVVPNQTSVTVIIVEGESTKPDECIPIGVCQIKQLPWGLRKGSTIYVTFSYDNSGRLDVKAVEATSGTTAQATIDRANAMPQEDIAKARQAMARIKVA